MHLKKTTLIGFLSVFLSLFIPVVGSPQINNKAQWDAAYDEIYGDIEPMLDITSANEEGRLAWEASYWLRAYISMAQTFSDVKYLDRAVRLIDFLLANRDDARHARGELDLQSEPYYTAPLSYLNNRDWAAPGWRHWDSHFKGWRILLVDEAMITSAIMRFVDLIYASQDLANYRTKAEHFMK